MGLTARLHALAAGRPHVLLLPVPGAAGLRVAAERELRVRGWVLATSPADADALLVAGAPGEALARVADRVFDQLPGPRVRLDIDTDAALTAALDDLASRLADRDAALADAAGRGTGPHGGQPDSAAMDDGDMDMGGMDDGDMDMGGMDMGGMSMDLPGGLAMADRSADRDGLMLDVLHEQVGPALPHWPAGLVLDCVLQGDVVVEATPQVLPGGPPGDELWAAHPVGHRLDRLATVVAVAGWDEMAGRLQRARDEALAEQSPVGLDRLLERVARSRTLGLLGRDLPSGHGHDVAAHVGDLCRGVVPAALIDPDRLAQAVTGLDIGSLRLVVAALAPDTDRMATAAGRDRGGAGSADEGSADGGPAGEVAGEHAHG